jgi:hypothetical protein
MNEIIRTSGDVRRFLAQAMTDVGSGKIEVGKGMTIAALAKEITASLQAEVNVAKVRLTVLATGSDMGKITHLGQLVIEDAGSVPTLSGAPESP